MPHLRFNLIAVVPDDVGLVWVQISIPATIRKVIKVEAVSLQVKVVLVPHGGLFQGGDQTSIFEVLLGAEVDYLIVVEAIIGLNLLTLDLIDPFT